MIRSLRARLILLISLAVLPLGLIAVQQTIKVIEDARELERQDILFRTSSAAAAEQELFREAFGAANAIGVAALEVGPGSAACDRIMERLVERSGTYVFAGFISPDGVLRCSHNGADVDFSADETWQEFLADPRNRLTVNRSGAVTGMSVVIATVPVFDTVTGTLLGAASVSVPHSIADRMLGAQVDGLRIALISGRGRVLSASEGIDSAYAFDAFGIVPDDMQIGRTGTTRVVTSVTGDDRLIAVVPLFDRDVYIVGIWENATATSVGQGLGWLAATFPILMWIAAIGVAVLALERLILRHLRKLRTRMKDFSVDAPTDAFVNLDDAPAEIHDIATTYNGMVDRILADHETLARSVAEKDLLLREVHHRVKNNLQLIASILNMQIRSLTSAREQSLLRRVQNRVMSLSTVHRALYETSHVGPVRADLLLRKVLDATFQGGLPARNLVDARVDAEAVILDADQAVPLVLLAAEATTNAIKFVGTPPDGRPTISVDLRQDEDGEVSLVVSNSIGPRLIQPTEAETSGLGSRLIEGFAAQLGSRVETEMASGRHMLSVRFDPISDDAEPMDVDSLSFYGARTTSPASGVR